jgi:hypothetical protein
MPLLAPLPPDLDPVTARPYLADLGFIVSSDLPDRPGPAYLLIAIRRVPTLHHYDPERIEFWVTNHGRGERREITADSRLPLEGEYSWGVIRIVDRLKVTNEYVSFGGRVVAARIDDTVVVVFTSNAPILRRGGHSQGWDHGAECVAAFFGRLMLAVDFVPGFEATLAAASTLARYCAFVADSAGTYRHSPALRESHPQFWTLIEAEDRRLRVDDPRDWSASADILGAIASAQSPERIRPARYEAPPC